MRKLKKSVSIILAVTMLLSCFVMSATVDAANLTTVKFDPGVAGEDSPVWYAWTWGDYSGGTWLVPEQTDDGFYVFSDVDTNILFVRKPEGTMEPAWTGSWSQTEDLTIDGDTFTITKWDGGMYMYGDWSGEPEPTETAQPETDVPEPTEATETEKDKTGGDITVDISNVDDPGDPATWYAWTWNVGEDGHWVNSYGESAEELHFDGLESMVKFVRMPWGSEASWDGTIWNESGDESVAGDHAVINWGDGWGDYLKVTWSGDVPEPETDEPKPTEAEDDAVYFDPGDVSGDWLAWSYDGGLEGSWIEGTDENGVLKFEGVSSNVIFVNTIDGDWSGRVGQTIPLATVYGGTYKLDGSEVEGENEFGDNFIEYSGDWIHETQPETEEPETDDGSLTAVIKLNGTEIKKQEINGDTLKVIYKLTADEPLVDGQGALNYNKDKLTLESWEFPVVQPAVIENLSEGLFNFARSYNPFDFTKGDVLVVCNFKVKADSKGDASVDLNIEELDSLDTVYAADGGFTAAGKAVAESMKDSVVVEVGEPEQTEAPETQKVYFTNNQYWGGTIYCYYWTDGDETPVEWPGIEMKDEGVNKYGEPYYSVELPVGVNVVFTNSKAQTTGGKFTGKESGFYPLSEKDNRGFWLLESWTEEETEPEPTEAEDDAVYFDPGDVSGDWLAWTWIDGGEGFWIQGSDENGVLKFECVSSNVLFVNTSDGDWSGRVGQTDVLDTVYGGTYKLDGSESDTYDDFGSAIVLYGGDWTEETQPETDEPEPVTEKPEPTEAEDDAVYFDPGDVSGDWLAWTWIDGGEGFWIQGSDENGVLKFEGVSSNVLFVNTSDGDWSGRVGQTDVLDTVYGGTYKLDGSESDSDDGFGNAIVLYGGDWTEETQPETDEPATDEPATDEPEPTEAEETQKVYFTNNQNWGGTIYCYYWTDGDETPVEWPGIEMKDEGVNKYGEPYYSVELPVGVNVVFTNSKAQTTEGKFTGKESGFYPLSEKDDRGFWLLESWTEEETEPATDEPEPIQPATYDPEVFKNAVTIDDSYFGNDGGIVLLWTWYEGDIDSHWVETVGNNVFTDIADAFVILRTSEDTLAEFKKDYTNWRTSDALFSYGSYQSGDIDTRVNETFKITGFGNGVISPHDETMVIYGLTGNWVGDEPIPETEEPETEPFTDEPTTPENKNWIVAGSSAEVFGTMWDPANTDNKMKKGNDGLYSITYSNVAAGEYEFKVTNGSWDECYGAENGANFAVNLEENSNITIKFNAKTKEISVAAESAQEPTEPETQKPTEPETQEPTEPETQEPTQPEDKGVISVGNAKALKGNTVEVPINIEKNPGIVGMTLKVNYPSALTLTEVKDGGILGANTHKPQLTSPYTLSWANDTANENYTATGTIATLVFKINDDAEVGNYNVEISYNKGNFDIYNKDMDEVGFTINNGKVEVIDYIIGDVNGDRKVNNLDRVYLTRHLADWDGYKEINKAAADLDGNGVVNNLDRVILTRHLADWAGYESLPYKK